MSKPSSSSAAERERLRQQWLAQAEAVFDLYYEAETPQTFTERETRACRLTRELACFLLEQDLAQDACAQPAADATVVCPKCTQPARPRPSADGSLPRRHLVSVAGEITLCRQQWHCKTCRVSFFPSGSPTPARHRGLQPGRATADRAAGGQGRLVSGRQ